MLRILLIYSSICIVLSINEAQASVHELNLANNHYATGLEYYRKRAEGASGRLARPDNIDKAIYHFTQALENPAYELKAGAALLRCFDFKGSFTKISDSDKIEMLEKGIAIGDELLKKYPDDVALMYWYMSNVGRWGQTVRFWKAVRANIAGKMRSLCERIIALDPSYNDAGAYRILGVLNIKIPHVPLFITWPSDDKGLDMLKKATELAPEAMGNWVFYAEALSKLNRKDRAISILHKVLEEAPREYKLIEDKNILVRASELLAEVENS